MKDISRIIQNRPDVMEFHSSEFFLGLSDISETDLSPKASDLITSSGPDRSASARFAVEKQTERSRGPRVSTLGAASRPHSAPSPEPAPEPCSSRAALVQHLV